MTIIKNMPSAEYHASGALSSGGIRYLLKSPAHYRAWRAGPHEPTAAMQFGTAVHTQVLEIDKWGEVVRVLPGNAPDKRTNAGKLWWETFNAELGNRILINHEQAERINAIRCSVINTPAAATFLRGGRIEESHFWKETHDGREIESRARPDFCVDDYKVIVDLKTEADASKEAFAKSVWNYRYDIQAAHYLDGVYATTGTMPHSYLWCVVETEAPYAVAWYRAEPRLLEIARMDIERAKSIYVQALTTGDWPAYPDTIQPLDSPRWARATTDNNEEETDAE